MRNELKKSFDSTMTPAKEYKVNEEKESEHENDETAQSAETSQSAETGQPAETGQSAVETLVQNIQSDEPPIETKVGLQLFQ